MGKGDSLQLLEEIFLSFYNLFNIGKQNFKNVFCVFHFVFITYLI